MSATVLLFVAPANADAKTAVRTAAKVVRAREHLNQLARLRLVARALEAQVSQADLAASLGISQASVSRLTHRIRSNGRVLQETATEIIERRAVGDIDDATMMSALLNSSYSPGRHDPTGGDGYIRGTWSEIEGAFGRGLLTEEEYETIAQQT